MGKAKQIISGQMSNSQGTDIFYQHIDGILQYRVVSYKTSKPLKKKIKEKDIEVFLSKILRK